MEDENPGKKKGGKKRSKDLQESSSLKDGQREVEENLEQISFEDPYEDEFPEGNEEEEIANEPEEEGMEVENKDYVEVDQPVWIDEADEEKGEYAVHSYPAQKEVWMPGDKLKPGEVLECDMSAYEMLHALKTEWPCLSFDILPDKLGQQRTKFPLTSYCVMGTQADQASNNKILICKMTQLHQTRHDDDSDFSGDDEDLDDDPELEFRAIKHPGAVNRLRVIVIALEDSHSEVMPQEPHVVASWSENSTVYLWDISQHARALDVPPTGKIGSDPVAKLTAHSSEGFALSWSHLKTGRLITGDCEKNIYLTDVHDNTAFVQDKVPFVGHTSSVEDLQWSPTETEVFASCSSDKTIKIWDCRERKFSARSFQAADCDVNVISWNRKVAYLLLSGADDGSFRIWDLRTLKSPNDGCGSVANFKWHTDQITSLEWSPTDDSVLAVASADNQVTLWDLSVEKDTETISDEKEDQLPPQLLFVHQGQNDIKEVHWHPQLPNVLMTTAEDGFNVFKPAINDMD